MYLFARGSMPIFRDLDLGKRSNGYIFLQTNGNSLIFKPRVGVATSFCSQNVTEIFFLLLYAFQQAWSMLEYIYGIHGCYIIKLLVYF